MSTEPGGPKKILAVDDEQLNLKVLDRFLKSFGFEPVLVDSGQAALEVLDKSFDLILLDVMMPEMDGFTLVGKIRELPEASDMPIIMVTALSSKDDRLRAVEVGANDFISKPIDMIELKVRMNSLLRMKESQDEVKRYQVELEKMVDVRTQALSMAIENMKQLQQGIEASHAETILRLSAAAEFKDEHTASHIKRMAEFSALLAAKYGLPGQEVDILLKASPMHDVGKIGVPDTILLKPGPLTPEEWEEMKKHTVIGARILEDSTSELLQMGEIIAISHHEKWDGSGYPYGLAGENIPVYGRLCAVADVFDALTTRRPYKDPFPNEKAFEIMRRGRGTHFDPQVLDLFFNHLDDILAIQRRYADV